VAKLSFSATAEKLFAHLQPKWPSPLWRVAGKLPLPRRGGFQSALLVGGLETAAPCVGASRLTHVFAAHRLQLRSRPRSGSRPGCRSNSRCSCRSSCRCDRGCGCRTRCSCGRGCWCRSRRRCGSWRCWHHRIRMSLAIVNTSAHDDAILANAQGRRGVLIDKSHPEFGGIRSARR